jgi:hypothetical protein
MNVRPCRALAYISTQASSTVSITYYHNTHIYIQSYIAAAIIISSTMDCCVADREHAVEVQVYERIKIQQPLLLVHCSSLPPSATTQLAQSLLSEALRALNVALSVMNQQPSPAPATPTSVVVKAERQLLSSSSPSHGAAPDPGEAIPIMARRGKRRRFVRI